MENMENQIISLKQFKELVKCPECSGMLKIQSEWCGQSVQCPLCQKTVTAPEAPAPAEPQAAQTATSPDAVKMRINDDIEATPKKIVEMLTAMDDGKEEFVTLSNGNEFLQTCLDKKKNNFHLEYSSGCFILEYLETTYNIF